jgi:hypothetical protein
MQDSLECAAMQLFGRRPGNKPSVTIPRQPSNYDHDRLPVNEVEIPVQPKHKFLPERQKSAFILLLSAAKDKH